MLLLDFLHRRPRKSNSGTVSFYSPALCPRLKIPAKPGRAVACFLFPVTEVTGGILVGNIPFTLLTEATWWKLPNYIILCYFILYHLKFSIATWSLLQDCNKDWLPYVPASGSSYSKNSLKIYILMRMPLPIMF